MPYRRSPYRSFSRRSNRRPRRYTWIRDDFTPIGVFDDSSLVAVDLLWPARQPPSSAGLGRAPTETVILPTVDLQDAMIERIRGKVFFSFTMGTTTTVGANYVCGISTDLNAGIEEPVSVEQAAGLSGLDPSQFPAKARTSWMLWDRVHILDPTYGSGEVGTGSFVSVYPFDVKSRRRLRDWGDNLLMCMNFNGLGDSTNRVLSVTSSVLISHR